MTPEEAYVALSTRATTGLELAKALRPKCEYNSILVVALAALTLSVSAAGSLTEGDFEKAQEIVKRLLVSVWRQKIDEAASDDEIDIDVPTEVAANAVGIYHELTNACRGQSVQASLWAGILLAMDAAVGAMDEEEKSNTLGILLYLLGGLTNDPARLEYMFN